VDRPWGAVALDAAEEAGRVDPALLGSFLTELASAAADGSRLGAAALTRCARLGERAGEQGVPLRDLVDLYLSAAWRVWRLLPPVADAHGDADRVRDVGEAVLRAVDDAVAAVGDGYLAGRRAAVRREESLRREFLDDLFSGTGDTASLAARADSLGMDLSGPRLVAVVAGARAFREGTAAVTAISRAVGDGPGGGPGGPGGGPAGPAAPDPLVTTREGMLVAVLPAGTTADAGAVLDALVAALDRVVPGDPGLRVGVGAVHPDATGVAWSFAEARDALDLAVRLDLPGRVVRSRDLLVYRVLLRDSAAMRDLMDAVLTPLDTARGGAGPLLDTLRAHAGTGANATATARALHLSVRAVSYRLRRVHELTGYDPGVPGDAYVLTTAALGARALGWPSTAGSRQERQLPTS